MSNLQYSCTNLGIFRTFFSTVVEDRFIENMNVGKWSMIRNVMIVRFVKKDFDICLSGCRQGPICPKKGLDSNRGLPNFF